MLKDGYGGRSDRPTERPSDGYGEAGSCCGRHTGNVVAAGGGAVAMTEHQLCDGTTTISVAMTKLH